ncbi:MAG TPA: hypothetical protein VFD04_04595 [Actinomycetes bacterium]|nr:hypothetical protein [Actinomycetes bacterium]
MSEEREAGVVCERCGRVRASACDCGGERRPAAEPEGWDPRVTRQDRPRLSLMARPEEPSE